MTQHAPTIGRHVVVGGGLERQLERALARESRLRRSRSMRTAHELGLDPSSGPAMLLIERYDPNADGFGTEPAREWLETQYANAIHLEEL